jgi:hypothetical protein
MSISERLKLLFEIIRVKKLKKLMFDKDYDELNTECKNIYDYEETNESEEPKLYEFRNFVANNKFKYNKKFILNIIKMTSINALRYFKNIITINLENNDDKKFIMEIIQINPISLYNLPYKIIFDYEIANMLILHYGGILEFLSISFRKNKELVKKCYHNHISCLMYAHDELLDDDEFMFEAALYDLKTLEYLSDRLKNNKLFFYKLINYNPCNIEKFLFYCGNEIFDEYKYKLYQNNMLSFTRLFNGKIEMHKEVPICAKFKNEFRQIIIKKQYKYNHYFEGYKQIYIPAYSYY